MASRKLEDLHPLLQPLARAHVDACEALGIDLLIYCTYRSDEEQDELYAVGRGVHDYRRRVTNARAGQSKHNHTLADGTPAALAYDCAPIGKGGKIDWANMELWEQIGQAGIALGLRWYGSPGSKFLEYPHFELAEVPDA